MGSVELVSNSVTDVNEVCHEKKTEGECKPGNLKQKLIQMKTAITIEPVLCCYLIGIELSGPAQNNLQLKTACKVNAGFNDTICDAVVEGTHAKYNFTSQNSEVQQYISDMLSWCIPIQSVVPVVLLLFVGTYSDRHSMRKPFLLIPVLGEFVGTVCSIICVIFIHAWPVEAVGLAQFVISSFFGGPSLITMAAFAYIADIVAAENRTARIAVIQISLSVCIPIAIVISGILFDAIGYIPSLAVSLVLFVMGFVYGVFFVKEPKQVTANNTKELLKDIVNPHNIVETFQLFTKTKGAQLRNIIFIVVILYISSTVIGGEDYVFFYFTQHAYGWNYTDYTHYYALYTVIGSLGVAAGVFILTKILHLGDLLLIALSFLDKIAANIVYITVKSSLGLYIGVLVGILQDVSIAAIRSLSTKYVSEEDIGKTQSLMTVVEAVAYAVAAQIYHQGIYTHTRDTYVQAFFYVAIGLYTAGIAILMWRYLNQKQQPISRPSENGNAGEVIEHV